MRYQQDLAANGGWPAADIRGQDRGCGGSLRRSARRPFTPARLGQSDGGRGGCLWNFGTDIPSVTTNDLGRDAQYGTPDVARYGGTIISPVEANPTLSPACGTHGGY